MTNPSPHHYQLRVTVEEADIDELEHVNNAQYLRYVEAVARAHADSVGMTLEVLKGFGVVPMVRKHVATYHRPARLGDTLRVTTEVLSMGGVRAQRHNEVRDAATDRLLVEVITGWVWVDPQRGRPRPVPLEVMTAFGWGEPDAPP